MLIELHIEDLGVIERVDLVLGAGFTALTGETGAGKTMLVEAIGLLVGGRADPSMVRTGSPEARVEGRFVLPRADGDDDEVVIARVVPAVGRSRAYVNGRLATAATLAEITAPLVDIHGQHVHQQLLGTAAQRDALDRFAAIDLTALRAARARLTEIDAALAALGGDSRTRARELDLIGFQLDELESAGLDDVDEDERLAAEEELLAAVQSHRESLAGAVEALDGDGGALDGLHAAVAALGGRGVFTAALDRLRALVAEADDVRDELRRMLETMEDDPARLAEVTARRHLLRMLRRKYGDTLADVISFRDEVRARRDELAAYDETVARLERERAAALADERSAAAEVAAARRAAAPLLAARIATHLPGLALPRAVVEIDVVGDDPGDEVVLRFSANPGLPALPLARVASGGELARVMLAVRLVLGGARGTLLFDEVDAGVGGAAAGAVGRALAELGARHQVLVVTHLAHVAALADAQVVVDKQVVRDERSGVESTVARARTVTADDRVGEVARMVAGTADGREARELAVAMLAEGAALRRDRSAPTGHGDDR